MSSPNPEPLVPTSRAAAVDSGAVRYFTGAQCPAGHVAERYTLNGYCVECQKVAKRNNRRKVHEKRGGGA